MAVAGFFVSLSGIERFGFFGSEIEPLAGLLIDVVSIRRFFEPPAIHIEPCGFGKSGPPTSDGTRRVQRE
jgi:hypothetical protein